MKSRGFTLVETLIVVVVLAVAGTVIAAMQGSLFSKQSTISSQQIQNQLLLECAEQILAVRKYSADGYYNIASGTSYGTNLCGGLSQLSGYTVPTVTITEGYTGAGCPSSATCKLVVISQSGASSLTLMLANY